MPMLKEEEEYWGHLFKLTLPTPLNEWYKQNQVFFLYLVSLVLVKLEGCDGIRRRKEEEDETSFIWDDVVEEIFSL